MAEPDRDPLAARRRELLARQIDTVRPVVETGRPEGSRPEGEEGDRPAMRGGFFGAAWFVAATAVLLLGAATGHGGLGIVGLLGLVSAGLAWGWARVALRGVVVTARFDRDHVLPGDPVELTVTVTNGKLIPVPWVTLEVAVPRGLRVGKSSLRRLSGEQVLRLSTALAPYGRLTWRSALTCPVRGHFQLDPVTVRAGDPFGFFTGRTDGAAPGPVTVYPPIVAIPELRDTRERLGDVAVRRHLQTDPTRIAGVRDYLPGDPFRSISWKATARLGTLQTRLEEPATSRQVLVCVNLDTHEQVWEGIDSALAEAAISAAASLLSGAAATGQAIGLMANGRSPGTPRPLVYAPAADTGQLARCLNGLARVSLFSTMPFSRELARLERVGDRDGTVIVVTALLTEPLRGAIALLVRQGRRVVLAPLGSATGAVIPGVPVIGLDQAAILARLTSPTQHGGD